MTSPLPFGSTNQMATQVLRKCGVFFGS